MLHVDHNYRRVMGTPSKYDSVFDFPLDSSEPNSPAMQRNRSAPPAPPKSDASVGRSVGSDFPLTPSKRGRPPSAKKKKEKREKEKVVAVETVEKVVKEVFEIVEEKGGKKGNATAPRDKFATPPPSSAVEQPLERSPTPDVIPFNNANDTNSNDASMTERNTAVNNEEEEDLPMRKRARLGNGSHHSKSPEAEPSTPPLTQPQQKQSQLLSSPFQHGSSKTEVTTYAGKRKRGINKQHLRDDTPVTPPRSSVTKKSRKILQEKGKEKEEVTPAPKKRGRPSSSMKKVMIKEGRGRPKGTRDSSSGGKATQSSSSDVKNVSRGKLRKSLDSAVATTTTTKEKVGSVRRRKSLNDVRSASSSKDDGNGNGLNSDDEDVFHIEEILDRKEERVGRKVVVKYLVHWHGYDKENDHTWEPERNLDCDLLIRKFEIQRKKKGKEVEKEKEKRVSTTTPKRGVSVKATPRRSGGGGGGVKSTPRSAGGSARKNPGSVKKAEAKFMILE